MKFPLLAKVLLLAQRINGYALFIRLRTHGAKSALAAERLATDRKA